MSKINDKKFIKNHIISKTCNINKQVTSVIPSNSRIERAQVNPKFLKKDINCCTLQEVDLDESYKDLLQQTLLEVVNYCHSIGSEPTASTFISVRDELTKVILAAQAGKIPPDRLRNMLAQSARQALDYSRWETQAGLESYHSSMIGTPRAIKVY